jgi:hypothetical protein
VLPGIIAIAIPVFFIVVGRDLGIVAWPFAAVALIFGLFAWWLYESDGAEPALLRGAVASIFVAITVYGVTFPLLPALFPSRLVADELRTSSCAKPQVASTGSFQEPSLVFLAGTDTRFTDGAGAAEFLNHGACRFVLIDARSERSFLTRADAIGLRYARYARIEGFNISIGRPVALSMFRSEQSP